MTLRHGGTTPVTIAETNVMRRKRNRTMAPLAIYLKCVRVSVTYVDFAPKNRHR